MNKQKKETNIPVRCELDNVTSTSVDIYLYGNIEDDDSLAYYTEEHQEHLITPGKVRNLVKEAKDRDINLHINSNGGSIYGSVAIMNYLKESKNTVNVFIDSVAFSGASIIAMAGDTINMYPNSMIMVHKAGVSFYGNSEDFKEMARILDKFDEVVYNSYLERFDGTEDQLKNLIAQETYLSAKECKAFNLCDTIVGEEREFPTIEDVKNKSTILDKLKGDQDPKVDGKEPKKEPGTQDHDPKQKPKQEPKQEPKGKQGKTLNLLEKFKQK